MGLHDRDDSIRRYEPTNFAPCPFSGKAPTFTAFLIMVMGFQGWLETGAGVQESDAGEEWLVGVTLATTDNTHLCIGFG